MSVANIFAIPSAGPTADPSPAGGRFSNSTRDWQETDSSNSPLTTVKTAACGFAAANDQPGGTLEKGAQHSLAEPPAELDVPIT